MRIKKYSSVILLLLLIFNQLQAEIPQRSGWWKFDNAANLQKAEDGYGVDLTLVGTQSAAAGPEAGNGSVLIGKGSYYKMQHQIPANGGGSFVNEYTLQYDFKVPAIGVWHSFFQTDMSNSNDGDFFINTSGNIGVAAVGYSTFKISPNEWYRMVISVKNGEHFICYLDGIPLISGNIQDVDGRFSLESLLLIFADEDGEDADIYCSELAIWSQALTAGQVSELGGFGHEAASFLMTRIPYLQAQGTNTMTVCWHDVAENGTKVKYGIDSTSLNMETAGTSEMISDPYRWHSVKLTGLQPNTRYFYKGFSGTGESGMFAFKTQPDQTYTGKMRFVILGDTHASDTTMAGEVLRASRNKITELYGANIENHVNGIFHSGDIVVSGSTPGQYTKQYFKPLSALSSNIPTMVVAGNHELESPYFYQYLKLDDQSAFPLNPALNEKMWQLQVGNSLFIGLNTNIIDTYGETEANWLDARLNTAEQDAGIDFVFVFFHHPPFSELWIVGGTDYVKNRLLPVMEKYTKVQEIHYGHTHGFERGTITSDTPGGDFRMICGGGGGGPLDPWVEGENQDFNDVQICISNYFYQILEIDMANHSFRNSVYSLGTPADPKNNELLDVWHKSKNQPGPETPVIENFELSDSYISFNTSQFIGADSLMSVQYQVIDSSGATSILADSIRHRENIYGIDQYATPVDLNKNINLYQSKISTSQLSNEREYFFRVRYRDQNLKWSNWSDLTRFTTLGTGENQGIKTGYILNQNYPNPFRNSTSIIYNIPQRSDIIFRIYDANYRQVATINEGFKDKGTHHLNYNAANLSGGVYFYEMSTENQCITKKMVKSQTGK
ncbi:MAG: metallophosphoesterase [Bacteroidales bacterium]|nr:metallophosphoesterase [Bacteroidales bacterium]